MKGTSKRANYFCSREEKEKNLEKKKIYSAGLYHLLGRLIRRETFNIDSMI